MTNFDQQIDFEEKSANPDLGRLFGDPASHIGLIFWAGLSVIAWLITSDWLAGLAIAVLGFGWEFLATEEGPPVLPLAFTFQWMQVASGLFYFKLTGITFDTIEQSDWRPMLLIGLGVLTSLAIGGNIGLRLWRLPPDILIQRPSFAFSSRTLFALYILAVLFSGSIQRLAWDMPQLTQPLIVLSYCRFGLFYLILRRLIYPEFKYGWVTVLVAFEVIIGFSGFFAGFREALMLAALALLERFNRKEAGHWVMIVMVGVAIMVTGLFWTSIKVEFRTEIKDGTLSDSTHSRLIKISELSKTWLDRGWEGIQEDMHRMVDRIWAIYFPALAVARVPKDIPHSDGKIFGMAIKHIVTPRLLFPNKPALISDSEMVREYAGVKVAGEDEDTSIAFGYAAESYVDFGLPLMFLPVLAYGVLIGAIYRRLLSLVMHRELAIALVTVIGWLGLYIFERSWAKTLGITLTMTAFLGMSVLMVDRFLFKKNLR